MHYRPLMQYEVAKFIAFIILSHFWMVFEEFVFTPYIETLFVIVGVLIAMRFLKIYSGPLCSEERDLPGDYEIICKQYFILLKFVSFLYCHINVNIRKDINNR